MSEASGEDLRANKILDDLQSRAERAKPLTWLGKLLVALTAVFTFGVAFPITFWLSGILGWAIQGRMLLVIPVVAVGWCFWVLVFTICEKLGLEIQHHDNGNTFTVPDEKN